MRNPFGCSQRNADERDCSRIIAGLAARKPIWHLPVTEVADPGEDHGDADFIGGCDNFGVADGATRLDDCRGTGLGDGLQAIGEGEEGVGGGDCAVQRETAFMAPNLAASTRLIWPAPTPTVWPKPS